MDSSLNFSLTQLEYALAVHRLGHFARAAEACHVTQPTLSMQIQKLEETLGVVLFDRTKKPILLTDAGGRLIEQFQAILFEAKKISILAETPLGEKTVGSLRLGVIPTMAPYMIPRLLPQIEKTHPGLTLQISELQTQQIIDALHHDSIDVGLLATPLKVAQLTEHPLFYEPFSVLCRKGHPISQLKKARYADLKFNDLWLLTEGHCLRNQVLDLCSLRPNRAIPRKYSFESGSLETLRALVDTYGGYTLIPQLATSTATKNSVFVEFDRPIPAREVGLVYLRKQFKTHLIEALAESILASVPEALRKIRAKDLDVLPVDS